jgi:hypothetical protein
MFDLKTIQSVIEYKAKAGAELVLAEATDIAMTANAELSAFGEFAGAFGKVNTPDEAINAAISFSALAFQRATAAFLRAFERGSEFSKGYDEDIRKAFAA